MIWCLYGLLNNLPNQTYTVRYKLWTDCVRVFLQTRATTMFTMSYTTNRMVKLFVHYCIQLTLTCIILFMYFRIQSPDFYYWQIILWNCIHYSKIEKVSAATFRYEYLYVVLILWHSGLAVTSPSTQKTRSNWPNTHKTFSGYISH